ncbi:MAG: SDR family NAD(P)-dependent oxidoreductase, partial [bacterium]
RETLLAALSKNIEEKYPVKAPLMVCDLSTPGAASRLFQDVQSKGYKVNHLINNAGVGDFVAFRDSNPEKMEAMMQLNMMALAQLTRLFIPAMLQRGEGRILQVASVAAFQPGPMMAVYFATKAFVLHFSEALHEELHGTGVTVTC